MLSETSSVMFRGWDPALQGQLAYISFFKKTFFLKFCYSMDILFIGKCSNINMLSTSSTCRYSHGSVLYVALSFDSGLPPCVQTKQDKYWAPKWWWFNSSTVSSRICLLLSWYGWISKTFSTDANKAFDKCFNVVLWCQSHWVLSESSYKLLVEVFSFLFTGT